ncbi:uncharacterized protein PADG_12311 [Paracoccidioides brasiliensis Pb18]|uniref:Cytochrome P450 n=1 Tax=Paracoccidioides brasiliensis (strain Pb18) TaxID=502780 RepID=A0A0A0HSK0_PARBD|nr:uncharacterized protein PADG_12311 [Paracoccidioides brasiliensis Pb18]KGM91627.1 hypothetical protein PADG_12311 [Paracoccidioides brasiliensis Pb18]ODH52755.1 hypothetical protein GX48_00949 [Paracoccidioides brasiliensis]
MRYLCNNINEILRLYPALPFNSRTALADTVLPIGGGPNDDMPITVLKGDIIIYSTPALHRRKDLNPPASESFADPGIFSPGR